MSRARVRSSRNTGVTLIEAAIGAGVLAAASAVLALWFGPQSTAHNADMAVRDATVLLDAAEQWKEDHGGCPTLSVLGRDAALSKEATTDDPWGSRYRIVCSENGVRVVSPGPDHTQGTADDLSVPRAL